MKIGYACKFDRNGYNKLNDLILENRRQYAEAIGCEEFIDYESYPIKEDSSWRHAEIMYETLISKESRFLDFIIGTGQNSLVTNFSITPCEQIEKYMDSKHEMILQSLYVDPRYVPVALKSKSLGGKLVPIFLTEPHIAIMGE